MAAAHPGGIVTVLPVYLVVDTSGSMSGESINAINDELIHLLDSLRRQPDQVETIRIALIQFDSYASEVFPLTDLQDITVPNLQAGGATDYGAAFRLVRQLIARDVAELRTIGLRIFRPVMVFITDGHPVDSSWRLALEELESPEFRERPTTIAIGFGSADPSVLREISRGSSGGGAFMVSDTLGIRDAITSIFSTLKSMLVSTVRSSVSRSSDVPAINLPGQWIDLSTITDII